ncbi:MAG: carboxypeptidase regulatory-like domain-containing protein [Vicinamibacterales bacterium]
MRVVRWLTALLALFTITTAGAPAARAQGTTSRVVGTVTDATSGVLPGATVTLTNEATNVAFATVTTSAGTYVFEAVQTGRYTIAAELSGFKKFVSTNNPVVVGTPTTINVRLEQGGVAETVEVRATSELVQTSTSGNIGNTLTQEVIEALPIVGARGRNPLGIVLVQPGVVSGANTGGGVHVHGARDRAWNFTLDGIDVNESSAGGSNFAPLRTNPDSLSEFRVITSNATAEFGRNSGGQVAMITRSGTNRLSGTAFYFHRRPEWNANEWENNVDNLPKRQFTQHIPGFSLGGPIQRDRTFFFVNTQWLRADQTQSRTRLVYTDLARQGIWRYVVNGRNQPAGVTGAAVDSGGNVLPGVNVGTYNISTNDPRRAGLDPTIQGIIQNTPLPNNFAVGDGLNVAGFSWTAPEEERQYDFVTKIDHVINAQHQVFARIAKGQQDTVCDTVNGGEPVFPNGPCLVNTERSPYNWAGNWRWNPRSNVVNEMVVGQNHFTFDFTNPISDASRPSYSVTYMTNATEIALPEDYQIGNLRTIDTYQFVDNLSWFTGRHSFKVGTNIRYQRHTDSRGSVAGANVAPVVNFSNTATTVDPVAFNLPGNMNVAVDRLVLQEHINFLLGRVGAITQGFVQSGNAYAPGGTRFNFAAWYPELDFYAQDTWKPRVNLTVDLGLRYEIKGAPTNPDDLILRPEQRAAVGTPSSNTLRWVQGSLYDNDVNNVGPALGVAWDPGGDGKQVFRANYRLAFDRINTFLLSSNIFQSIPGITTPVTNTAFGQGGGRLRDGVPSLQPAVTPEQFLQPPSVSSSSIRVVDPEFESPYTHGWAIGYQRELWANTVVDVTYIGRRAEHLFGAYNVNQVNYRTNGFLDAFNVVKAGGDSALINRILANDTRRLAGETGSQMMRRVYASEIALNSVAAVASGIGTRIQNNRTLVDLAGLPFDFFFPYPQFLGGVLVMDSQDYSRYHALEVKLDRRFATGFSYQLAYTLSRSKDTRSFDPAFTVVSTGNAQSASSTPFDIFNRDLNYALSDFDRTHAFQVLWVAELPFGRGRRWGSGASPVMDAIIGGWQVAGSMLVASGRPFTVYSGSNTFSNIVQTPANCSGCSADMGSVHPEGADQVIWEFTPEEIARFSNPAAGEFGTTGRNAFRSDGPFNIDLAVSKRIQTFDDQRLEFRIEATNLTNTPTFGLPTATLTNATFGRIRNVVASTARQVQMALKYSF